MEDLLGGAWLVERFGLRLGAPLRFTSTIGTRRASRIVDGSVNEIHPPAMRPGPSLKAHLTFHLKHEPPNLELLARLFDTIDSAELESWLDEEPTGSYARRAGFLYEWLTNRRLQSPDARGGAVVDAIDAAKVLAAHPDERVMSRRWRVRDNLPGTSAFCPIVRLDPLKEALAHDVSALLSRLRREFDQDLLMRAALWLTLRESRASFVIEGEGAQTDRIQRFANVLGRRTGQGDVPLSNEALAQLQGDILGKATTLRQFGLRRSPVFVGESDRYQEIVHYIAPGPESVPAMLEGLRVFLARTRGASPIARSAVAAFGFVYIHPLADGNGRVHRFLVNDILRRDGAVPEPYIIPISALITGDAADRRAYDRILEEVSKPLMELLAGTYRFGPRVEYADGIWSNLKFDGAALAGPTWRFPDLTRHVAYLAEVLARTIGEHMREESRYLRSHGIARRALKDLIEMPDAQADRIIRSVEENRGRLTRLLAREIPALHGDGIWERVVAAVRDAFAESQDPPQGTA